jgi:hypothetical protein
MAKTNEWKISPEGQAANEAGEKRRHFEADARRRNAKKQKDFRANMKAKGYKQVTAWEKPPAAGMVKAWKGAAPEIHEISAGIYERDDKMKKAVKSMLTEFFISLRVKESEMSAENWIVYKDIETLLAPLGYKPE